MAGPVAGGIALDGTGNLYVSTRNGRVRVVAAANGTVLGVPVTAGGVFTVAGGGAGGSSGDGGQATLTQLHHPYGIALDAGGNLFVADSQDFAMREVATGSAAMAAPRPLVS